MVVGRAGQAVAVGHRSSQLCPLDPAEHRRPHLVVGDAGIQQHRHRVAQGLRGGVEIGKGVEPLGPASTLHPSAQAPEQLTEQVQGVVGGSRLGDHREGEENGDPAVGHQPGQVSGPGGGGVAGEGGEAGRRQP